VADSPPLGAGVDAYALAAVTGNVLLVLRVGTTDREVAEAKLEVLLLPGGAVGMLCCAYEPCSAITPAPDGAWSRSAP
jgi:hypothetical protein